MLLQRTRSRPPAPHSVTAKTEAILQSVGPSVRARYKSIGSMSQAAAMVAAMALLFIPKAKGMEMVEQACTAQSISVGNGGFVVLP